MRICNYTITCINMILIALFLFLSSGLQAQETTAEKAKAFASDFLLSQTKLKKTTDYSGTLREVYRSPDSTVNKLFGFQNASAGFVLLAEQGDGFLVTAYSENGIFDTSYFDRGLSSLVDYYENATSLIAEKKTGDMLKNLDVKVDPLLEAEPVKWG